MSYAIVTDTSANIPARLTEKYDLHVLPFTYCMHGEDIANVCYDCDTFDGKTYYDLIRNGLRVYTSQVTPQTYEKYMTPILESGQDILFVGMSSGISSSFASMEMAREALLEKFPERKIRLVDTKGASLGEGFIAIHGSQYRANGMELDECADKLIDETVGMCQVFTVDDLMHLRKTGRLSNATAIIGTVLNIKPLLKGDQDGRIVSFDKVRGRKRSIEAIAKYYDELVKDAGDQTIGIAHADCQEDVDRLISLLKKNNPPKDILTVMYEPVTGSHVGPNALALFFFGDRNFRSRK